MDNDKKWELQAFYTPPSVVEMVHKLAEIEPGMKVLEPSVGDGALIKGLVGIDLVRYDINPDVEADITGDFLEMPIDCVFDRIIMNPPFTKSQDALHIIHAFKFLKKEGVLVSVLSAKSVETMNTAPRRNLRGLIKKYGELTVLPDDAFVASGTGLVKTYLLRLRKI